MNPAFSFAAPNVLFIDNKLPSHEPRSFSFFAWWNPPTKSGRFFDEYCLFPVATPRIHPPGALARFVTGASAASCCLNRIPAVESRTAWRGLAFGHAYRNRPKSAGHRRNSLTGPCSLPIGATAADCFRPPSLCAMHSKLEQLAAKRKAIAMGATRNNWQRPLGLRANTQAPRLRRAALLGIRRTHG